MAPTENPTKLTTMARTVSEVKDAINSLKKNKAPGDDSIAAELFKVGGERLVIAVHELITRSWSEETLPNEWKTGVICPIFKKGCKLECQNYRGISLLPYAYKIFPLILATRLKPLMEGFLHPYQAGFRKGMSTKNPEESRHEYGNRSPIHRLQGSSKQLLLKS